MVALPRLNDAFEIIHEASFDSSLWPQAIASITTVTHGAGSHLIRAPQLDAAIISPETAESLALYYKHGWNTRDLRLIRGFEMAAERGIVVDQDFIDLDEMKREPFYQEFLAQFGAPWFAALTMQVQGNTWALVLHRADPFLPVEQERLLSLRSKLIQAGETAGMMAQGRAQGYLEGLELAGRPAATLDWRGRVLDINSALQNILGQGINIKARRLVCTPAVQSALDKAIAAALEFDPRRLGSLGRVALPAKDGGHLFVTVFPYRQGTAIGLGNVRAVVVFNAPKVRRDSDAETIALAFGLTPAESRLTAALLRTGNLTLAAKACNLTTGSARQYMKRIFQKTQTSNQVEVTSLILGSGLL